MIHAVVPVRQPLPSQGIRVTGDDRAAHTTSVEAVRTTASAMIPRARSARWVTTVRRQRGRGGSRRTDFRSLRQQRANLLVAGLTEVAIELAHRMEGFRRLDAY